MVFDPSQQGDAIADVGTHLIDLAQWQCFPEQVIDYKTDINILSSKIWSTPISLSQYSLVTGKNTFPAYLQQFVQSDSMLQTHGNGEVTYTLKGVHVKLTARWEYKAAEGGDSHYSLIKGTKANLEIKQGKEEGFQPVLYIHLLEGQNENVYTPSLQQSVDKINETYPGITLEKAPKGWKVMIPENYKVGHEAHFAQVMQRYMQFLNAKKLPEWEVPNMLAKYYTATQALQKASK
jgi:predicted dehydrogenase